MSNLTRPPYLRLIEAEPRLNMPRMCGQSEVGYAQKVPPHDSRHFQAIKVLPAHLRKDALQRCLQTGGLNRTKGVDLDFVRHEKAVPSSGANLAVERETAERSDHAPVIGIGFTFQPKGLGHARTLLNQNAANVNGVGHGFLIVQRPG